MTTVARSLVTETSAPDGTPPGRRLAVVAAGGFLVIVSFLAALALGAPFGAAAWGGENPGVLPSELRVASAVQAVVWSLAALTVLARGRFDRSPVPFPASRLGTWALVGLLALGTAMNIASSSPWERFGWAPLVLALTVVCAKLARTDAVAPSTKTPAGRSTTTR